MTNYTSNSLLIVVGWPDTAQSANASMTLHLQSITRLINELLTIGLGEVIVMANATDLRPQDLCERVSEIQTTNLRWQEAHITKCDASHFRGTFLFLSLMLRHIAPEARLTRWTAMIWLTQISSCWRSNS